MGDLSLERHNNISAKIDPSANNVPTAFDATAGSLVMTGVALARGFAVINNSTSAIAINYQGAGDGTLPTTTLAYCPAAPSGSYSTMVMDGVEIGPNIYIRSDEVGAIASGIIRLFVW